MKNVLGIIGGLGPLASSYLYEMITRRTKVNHDQDHIDIILLSHASIPDRTNYILDHSQENPYPYLLDDCKLLEKLGAKMISIPCNTAQYFHDQLQQEIGIPINNLITETVQYIKEKKYKKVAILATEGTIKTKLYQQELDKYQIGYVLPDQEKVTRIIYEYVKKGKNVTQNLVDEIIGGLDADAYILGCTELSVIKGQLNLNEKFIDPLEIEVDYILSQYQKLKN